MARGRLAFEELTANVLLLAGLLAFENLMPMRRTWLTLIS